MAASALSVFFASVMIFAVLGKNKAFERTLPGTAGAYLLLFFPLYLRTVLWSLSSNDLVIWHNRKLGLCFSTMDMHKCKYNHYPRCFHCNFCGERRRRLRSATRRLLLNRSYLPRREIPPSPKGYHDPLVLPLCVLRLCLFPTVCWLPLLLCGPTPLDGTRAFVHEDLPWRWIQVVWWRWSHFPAKFEWCVPNNFQKLNRCTKKNIKITKCFIW